MTLYRCFGLKNENHIGEERICYMFGNSLLIYIFINIKYLNTGTDKITRCTYFVILTGKFC